MTYEDDIRLLMKVLDHLGLKLVYSHRLYLATAKTGQAIVLAGLDIGQVTKDFTSMLDVLDKVLKAHFIFVQDYVLFHENNSSVDSYDSAIFRNDFAGMTKEQAAIKVDLEDSID